MLLPSFVIASSFESLISGQRNSSLIQAFDDCDCGDCACVTGSQECGNCLPNDCDCDCGNGLVPWMTTVNNDHLWAATPYLSGYINNHHWALPYGSVSGVVVLNDHAHRLLQAFTQPASLQTGLQNFAHLPGYWEAARQLMQVGLLVPHASAPTTKSNASPTTLTAWVHVTNACNLACTYCYISKSAEKMEFEQGRQAIDAVFRSARYQHFQAVKLKYSGGEASLSFPLVLALHTYARQLADAHKIRLEVVVLSNGIGWTKARIDDLKTHGLRLMISLDGVGAAHDHQRPMVNGQGSFHLLERTLDLLAACDFTPSISVTLSHQNAADLPETVKYLLARRLPFTLNFYRENQYSDSVADLAYSEQTMIDAMRAAFAVIEADLPPYSLLGVLTDRARLDVPHERPCGVGQNYLVINHHGGVAKCQMLLDQTVGDITLDDPLYAVQMDTQGVQNVSVEDKEGCRDCQWQYWCAGGCPVLTQRVTGRTDVKSPNCNIYQALFPEVLRLEALRLLKYAAPDLPLC